LLSQTWNVIKSKVMKNTLHTLRFSGLSLVEILVVLGLFSGIATLSLSVLFNTQAINVKLLQSQAILDNVNLSLQSLSREMHYGSRFYCTSSFEAVTPILRKGCPRLGGGGGVLYFLSSDAGNEKDRTVYFVTDGILYKRDIPFVGASTTYQLTSEDVYITRMRFFVEGANTSTGVEDVDGVVDYSQPLISLFISGRARVTNGRDTPVPFYIQTHISPRVLDNS
jgi:type II secretory pathway pseudopilin PulG